MQMKYDKRGVSAEKKDVHNAIKNLDKGLYENTFCKILPDIVSNDPEYAMLMHADTAGTKTSLAYIYWKETGDLSVWEGIVRDAIVMNLDDLACVGAFNNIILSSTIGRNKNLISGEVIKTIIEGTQKYIDELNDLGIVVSLAGGETADVGDIVRTIDIGFTAYTRLHRKDILKINIKPGDVIVGLQSFGQSTYEDEYNSGIGSNGLTFARHEVLHHDYAKKYPESYDPNISEDLVYSGKMRLDHPSYLQGINIGKLLLSPTRTYIPVIRRIYEEFQANINGIIHCTGGGQTKVLHFIDQLHIIKNDLFPVPPVFKHIQEQNNSDWRELYQVFNMGQRLEIYTDKSTAQKIIDLSEKFNIKARIIGYCENAKTKKLSIKTPYGIFEY